MERLFLLSGARKRQPAVTAWFAEHPGILGALASQWFGVARRAGSDVAVLLHDGCPVACVQGAAFVYVNVFKAHVNVGFYQGAALPDPAGLLQGNGKCMRHVKVEPGTPLDEAALAQLIHAAYADVCARLAKAD